MPRKGIVEIGPEVIAYSFITIAIIAVLLGYKFQSDSFLRQQTLELQSERIENAAMGLDSMDQGSIGISLPGYRFHVRQGEMVLGYTDENATQTLADIKGFSSYRWSYPEPQKLEQGLCLQKIHDSGQEVLRFEKGVCS